MADFLEGPVICNLPLWIGEDTDFIINRRNGVDEDGLPVYVDYDIGTTARIIIDKKEGVITREATISGHAAAFKLLSTDTDSVKKETLWRVQFTLPLIGNKVPIAGKVVRKGE